MLVNLTNWVHYVTCNMSHTKKIAEFSRFHDLWRWLLPLDVQFTSSFSICIRWSIYENIWMAICIIQMSMSKEMVIYQNSWLSPFVAMETFIFILFHSGGFCQFYSDKPTLVRIKKEYVKKHPFHFQAWTTEANQAVYYVKLPFHYFGFDIELS